MSVDGRDPWGAVRSEIESAAQDGDLSADAKIAKLRLYRDDLNDLLGRVDTYTGDLELVREGLDPAFREQVLEMRENADLRTLLLDRGLATPDELDALGYISHDDLNKLDEEGLLDEWVAERSLSEFGVYEEAKHPRGRGGKFTDVLGRAVHPKGRHGGKVPLPPARHEEHTPAAPDAPAEAPRPHLPAPSAVEPTAEAVQSDIAKASEIGLNGWPEKGDTAKSLLGMNADTREAHTIVVRGAGGSRVYTPERQELHDRIIDTLLRQRQPVENSRGVMELHPHPEGEELKPPTGTPQVLFMAGGTASGKSTALSLEDNAGVVPPDAAHVDPDEIKAMLPEYVQMVAAGDKYAAMGVHEESSDVARRLLTEAMKRGLNIVRDGTGDSPGPKFAGQITDMAKAGYETHVFYVNAPTEVALVRAAKRAQRTGRWVPEPEIRAQHQNVSARFVEHVRPLVEDGTISRISMFQIDATPTRFAEGGAGSFNVLDQGLYDQFEAKAKPQGAA